MRCGMWLLALALWAPIEGSAQTPACQQPLGTLTVARSSYAGLSAPSFEQRVYVYVPPFKAGGPSGFQPFQVWIVEGVYGKPFVQAAGGLDAAGFEKLRGSQNVRATPVPVNKGNGSDWGRFRLVKDTYQVQILKVNPSGAGAVQLRVCR
jgi:hypothetical protein